MRIRLETTLNIYGEQRLTAAETLETAGAEPATSSAAARGDNPILDLQSLCDIANDTGGPALALRFLSDFLSLQPVRLARLLAALDAEEPAASVDAVLSLQTASSMAGATEIAEHCARILPLVVARDFPRARVQVAALERSVDVLMAASPKLLAHAEARLGTMGAVAAVSP